MRRAFDLLEIDKT